MPNYIEDLKRKSRGPKWVTNRVRHIGVLIVGIRGALVVFAAFTFMVEGFPPTVNLQPDTINIHVMLLFVLFVMFLNVTDSRHVATTTVSNTVILLIMTVAFILTVIIMTFIFGSIVIIMWAVL